MFNIALHISSHPTYIDTNWFVLYLYIGELDIHKIHILIQGESIDLSESSQDWFACICQWKGLLSLDGGSLSPALRSCEADLRAVVGSSVSPWWTAFQHHPGKPSEESGVWVSPPYAWFYSLLFSSFSFFFPLFAIFSFMGFFFPSLSLRAPIMISQPL